MFELLSRGGPVMLAIVLCSIASVAIILERVMLIRSTKKRMDDFRGRVEGILRHGHFEEVGKLCREQPNPMGRIILAGLERAGASETVVKEAIQSAGEREAARLEKHMNGLATIVSGAPLLGFLGTVLGMITAFQQIESLGGNVNASVLAGGIWQAMLTTAAGLTVAAPTLFAYNFIQGRIRSLVMELEEGSQSFLDVIRGLRAKRPTGTN